MALYDTRRSGDRTPFYADVDLGETVNLGGAGVTFTLASLDLATRKIDAQSATTTDVTETAGATPPLSVWRLSYEPTLAESQVSAPQDFLGWFTITFSGGKTRHYPKDDYIRTSVGV
jgi:hypothetical protein